MLVHQVHFDLTEQPATVIINKCINLDQMVLVLIHNVTHCSIVNILPILILSPAVGGISPGKVSTIKHTLAE